MQEAVRDPALGLVIGLWVDKGATGEFAEVFARHHAEAVRLAYVLTGNADRAEDITADAFVKVFRRWGRGGIENPRAYIRRAVVNEANSRFRRLALERREHERRRGDQRGHRTAEEHLADADEMFGALQRLPARMRTAIVLRYYVDLSETDAAEAMGVSVGTVKSAVSRGLKRLRAVLGEEAAEPPTGGGEMSGEEAANPPTRDREAP